MSALISHLTRILFSLLVAYDERDSKPQFHSSTLPRTSTKREVKAEPTKVPLETLNVHVVKGSNGFGFTIGDSSQGQRIKQIMDASRCQDLMEGDLLIEINGFNVQRYSHNEVVNMLKSCPRDTEAAIILRRGGKRRIAILFVQENRISAMYFIKGGLKRTIFLARAVHKLNLSLCFFFVVPQEPSPIAPRRSMVGHIRFVV